MPLVIRSTYSLHAGNEINGRRQQFSDRLILLTTRGATIFPLIEIGVADYAKHDAKKGRPGRNEA